MNRITSGLSNPIIQPAVHQHWVFIFAGVLISGHFMYVYAIAPKLQMNRVHPRTAPGLLRFVRVVHEGCGLAEMAVPVNQPDVKQRIADRMFHAQFVREIVSALIV
jgi:hypothetical protein